MAPQNEPLNADLAHARGLLAEKQTDAALHILEAMVTEGAGDPSVYELMAIALNQRGDPEAAAGAWSRAVALAPGNPSYRLHLAVAYHRMGRLAAASEELAEARRLAPGDRRTAHMLALLREAGAPAAAVVRTASVAPSVVPGASHPPTPPVPPPGHARQARRRRMARHRAGVRFMRALGQILACPGRFASGLEGNQEFWPPVRVLASTSALAGAALPFVLFFVAPGHFGLSARVLHAPSLAVAACVLLLLAPVTAVAALLANAAVVHVFVLLLGGRGGYTATSSALAYATVPLFLVGLLYLSVHALGAGSSAMACMFGAAGVAWALGIFCVALRELHRMEGWRALASALAPAVVTGVLLTMVAAVLTSDLRARAHAPTRNSPPAEYHSSPR